MWTLQNWNKYKWNKKGDSCLYGRMRPVWKQKLASDKCHRWKWKFRWNIASENWRLAYGYPASFSMSGPFEVVRLDTWSDLATLVVCRVLWALELWDPGQLNTQNIEVILERTGQRRCCSNADRLFRYFSILPTIAWTICYPKLQMYLLSVGHSVLVPARLP